MWSNRRHWVLPVAGELGSDLTLPCPSMFVPPTHTLVPLGRKPVRSLGVCPAWGSAVASRLRWTSQLRWTSTRC